MKISHKKFVLLLNVRFTHLSRSEIYLHLFVKMTRVRLPCKFPDPEKNFPGELAILGQTTAGKIFIRYFHISIIPKDLSVAVNTNLFEF